MAKALAAGSGDEPCVVGSPGFVILPLRGGHGALVHGALNEVGAGASRGGRCLFRSIGSRGITSTSGHHRSPSLGGKPNTSSRNWSRRSVSTPMSVPAMRPSYAANWRDWSRRATTLGMSPEASRIMGRTHGTRIWSWARTGWSSCRTARRRSLSGATFGELAACVPVRLRAARQSPRDASTRRLSTPGGGPHLHRSHCGTPSSLTQYRFNPFPRPDRWPRT